jgi:hypothetical protein
LKLAVRESVDVKNKLLHRENIKMRNLASVQEISGIKPIEGADSIELVLIFNHHDR